jgi:dolichol-phosphate mannosyltransferase
MQPSDTLDGVVHFENLVIATATSIDYVAPARYAGQSGYSLRKMMRLSVHAITGLSSKPLRISFYLGIATALFCLAYATYAVFELWRGNTVPGWTSVFVMVTFLGAVQLVSIAILGEYIGRIYEQSRGMPRYVIVEDAPQQGIGLESQSSSKLAE